MGLLIKNKVKLKVLYLISTLILILIIVAWSSVNHGILESKSRLTTASGDSFSLAELPSSLMHIIQSFNNNDNPEEEKLSNISELQRKSNNVLLEMKNLDNFSVNEPFETNEVKIGLNDRGQIKFKRVFNNSELVSQKQYDYYENGQVSIERNYKNGKRNGPRILWQENGIKIREGIYKDNELTVLMTFNPSSGQISSKQNYINDELNGVAIYWYENGQIKSERNYINNDLNGVSTTWNENGQKITEGSYKNSIVDGKWIFWKYNGQKDEERNYKDGSLVDKLIFKYSFFTGQLKSEKKYKYR